MWFGHIYPPSTSPRPTWTHLWLSAPLILISDSLICWEFLHSEAFTAQSKLPYKGGELHPSISRLVQRYIFCRMFDTRSVSQNNSSKIHRIFTSEWVIEFIFLVTIEAWCFINDTEMQITGYIVTLSPWDHTLLKIFLFLSRDTITSVESDGRTISRFPSVEKKLF